MATVTSIELFNALKDKVGEKEAKMLTEYMDYKAVESFDKIKSQVAMKEDLSKLELNMKDSISKLEVATKDSISKLELDMKDSILKLELAMKDSISKLEIKIGDYKFDTIKWMFAFFIPFYAGLIVFLIKYFL